MDKSAFVRSMCTWQEPLRRYLLVLSHGNEALTDDLAQETILKAYLHCESFRGEAALTTWVWRIATNEYLNSQRSFWATHREEEANWDHLQSLPYHPDPSPQGQYQALYQAIHQLRPAERAAVLLYYMEEKSIREISLITGQKISAITVTLFRARQHLKRLLS